MVWKGFLVGAAVTMGWAILDLVIGPEIDANFIHIFIASTLGGTGALWAERLPSPGDR